MCLSCVRRFTLANDMHSEPSRTGCDQEMRQRHKSLGKQAEALVQGERLLVRQRHQFPEGWPETSMVEAAYGDFETILGRRCVALRSSVLERKLKEPSYVG